MALGFFDGASTPEQLARRRAELDFLASGMGRAQNVGQGVGDILRGVGVGLGRYRANKTENAGIADANTKWSAFNPFQTAPTQAPQVSGGATFPNPALITPQQSQSAPSNALMSKSTSIKDGIAATAKSLGIDPVDLATAISYETAGTFDPSKAGPRTQWGQHKGLIQFGEPQAKKYGVNWDDPVGSQLGENGAVAKYLRDTGVKPGMGMMDIYSAINAGGVGRNNRSDANNGGAPGTVADKVNKQMAGHRAKAMKMFGGQQQPVQVASNDPQFVPASAHPQDVSQETMQQPIQQPQQVAQGGDDARLQQLWELSNNAFLPDDKKTMVRSLLEQEMKKRDPAYKMQMEADQLGLEKSRLEIDALKNPKPKPIEVGGRLIDPTTYKPLYEPPVDTNDAGEWGLQPIPVRDPKTGQLKLMITSKSGVQKLMEMPQGYEAAPNLQYLDTGTGFQPVDKRGGAIPDGVAPVSKDVAGEAAANTSGKLTAEANVALPGAETKGAEALSMIQQLADHPSLASNTGAIEGRAPAVLQDLRDPRSADFRARLEQVKGQSFLSAFEALKGAGAITEQEGAAATKAMARLDQAQSGDDFKTALKDLQQIIVKGIFNARVKAGKEKPAPSTTQSKPVEDMTDAELEALVNGQ